MTEKDIMPDGWETDVALQRSTSGTVGKLEVPDDCEVSESADA